MCIARKRKQRRQGEGEKKAKETWRKANESHLSMLLSFPRREELGHKIFIRRREKFVEASKGRLLLGLKLISEINFFLAFHFSVIKCMAKGNKKLTAKGVFSASVMDARTFSSLHEKELQFHSCCCLSRPTRIFRVVLQCLEEPS